MNLFSKIAHWASFLCLIHCIASSLFAVLAPQLLRYLPHNYWIEGSIWVLASASAFWMLKRTTCRRYPYVLLSLLFAAGLYFISLHYHGFFVAALLTLAVLQMLLTVQHHWRDHQNGDCHTHTHHHVGHCPDEEHEHTHSHKVEHAHHE